MDLPATSRPRPIQAAAAVLIVALLVLAAFFPVPAVIRDSTVTALFNFAHFGLAGGACWYLSARMRWPAWAAFAAAVTAAAFCEILQSFTGRCPATTDFVRGLLGALAGLICLLTFRRSVPTARWISASAAVAAVSAWPISEFLLATAKFCLRVTSWVS